MPKTTEKQNKCAMCGETSAQPAVRAGKRHGSPDLDTRAPANVRFNIDTWVQRCLSCGLCFPDIAKSPSGAIGMVQSDTYQKQLQSEGFPKLANSFLCWSLVEEQAGNFANAGWACIHAAWVCDDAADFSRLYGNVSGSKVGTRDEAAAATLCRAKAVKLLKRARDVGQGFGAQAGSEEALMADLLRRIARFESALKMVQCGIDAGPRGVVDTVLRFEKELAEKHDTDVHTISEALKWKNELPQTSEAKGKDVPGQA